MVRVLFVAIAAVLACAAVTPAQDERKDHQVFNDIARQVTNYPRFSVFDDVSASVEQGVVTLTGKVTMGYKADDIGRRVARIAGVREVRNRISVLPVSRFDDDLRYRVARSIYGNPTFWHYAAMAHPPIHIVVENGNVTLTGVVNNDVERVLARALATQAGARSVTNALRTDAEASAEVERMEN